jgi:hypothetical protein
MGCGSPTGKPGPACRLFSLGVGELPHADDCPSPSAHRGYILRAQQLGLIDPDADLEVAVTLCTGS